MDLHNEDEIKDCKEKANAAAFTVDFAPLNAKNTKAPKALLDRLNHQTYIKKFECLEEERIRKEKKQAAREKAKKEKEEREKKEQEEKEQEEKEEAEEAKKKKKKKVKKGAKKMKKGETEPIETENSTEKSPTKKGEEKTENAEQVEEGKVEELELKEVGDGKRTTAFELVSESPKKKQAKPPAALLERLSKKEQPKKERSEKEGGDLGLSVRGVRPMSSAGRPGTNRRPNTNRQPNVKEENNDNSNFNSAEDLTDSLSGSMQTEADKKNVVIGTGIGIEDQQEVAIPEAEKLTKEVRKQYGDVILVFGEEVTKHLVSQKWQLKSEALKKTTEKLQALISSGRTDHKVWATVIQIIVTRNFITDPVLQIFMSSIELLQMVSDGMSSQTVQAERGPLNDVIVALIQKSGDSNQRVCKAATDMILSLVKNVGLEQIVTALVQPVLNPTTALKKILSKLSILSRLVQEYKFSDTGNGIRPQPVIMFTLGCLDINNKKVREQAAQLVVETYALIGLRTIHFLNTLVPDDADDTAFRKAVGPLFDELLKQATTETCTSKKSAEDALLALSQHDKMGLKHVVERILQASKDVTPSIPLRLGILSRFVRTFGFPKNSGLTAEPMMRFAIRAFHNANEEVKTAAGSLVVSCHRKVGASVWGYLENEPPEVVDELQSRISGESSGRPNGYAESGLRKKLQDAGLDRTKLKMSQQDVYTPSNNQQIHSAPCSARRGSGSDNFAKETQRPVTTNNSGPGATGSQQLQQAPPNAVMIGREKLAARRRGGSNPGPAAAAALPISMGAGIDPLGGGFNTGCGPLDGEPTSGIKPVSSLKSMAL